MRLCGHWRRRYDKRYNNRTILSGKECVTQIGSKSKLVGTLLYLISLFLFNSIPGYVMTTLFLILVIKISKVPFSFIVRGLKPVIMLLMITVLFNLFLTRDGAVLFQAWIFTITEGGLRTAVYMASRLIYLIIGSSLMTFTTTPNELTDGIEELLGPLNKIRVPVHEIAMIMSIALRFIPFLLEETDKIMKAQIARGADLESGNMIQKAKSMIPILVPLFVSAFRRANDLAMAMEARCYRGGEGRTKMKPLKYCMKEQNSLYYCNCLCGSGGCNRKIMHHCIYGYFKMYKRQLCIKKPPSQTPSL